MRQVFSSARVENVEAVAKMLEAEGIEVRIENGPSFRSAIRGNFSYRDGSDKGPRPAVWVVRSDDQPRARQLLRDAGLLNTATTVPSTFLAPTPHAASSHSVERARKRTSRFRIGLLAAIAIIALGVVFKPRPSPRPVDAADAVPGPGLAAIATAPEAQYLLPTPPALAAAVAVHELERHGDAALCLAVDGKDPPPGALDVLKAGGIAATALSTCGAADAVRVDVHAWRTDGSSSGTVEWTAAHGTAAPEPHAAAARREGDDWHVTRGR